MVTFLRFFENRKNMIFLRFLRGCTRFLEHCQYLLLVRLYSENRPSCSTLGYRHFSFHSGLHTSWWRQSCHLLLSLQYKLLPKNFCWRSVFVWIPKNNPVQQKSNIELHINDETVVPVDVILLACSTVCRTCELCSFAIGGPVTKHSTRLTHAGNYQEVV